MDSNDQDFLNQIEQNIRSRDNEQDDARREAEQRAAEMERVRTSSLNVPGLKPAAKATHSPKPTNASKNPLQDDPRYKEYFERLRRQKGEAIPEAKSVTDHPKQNPQHPARESQSVGPGAIVQFDDGSIGIYKDAVSGKDYALFYFLQPDGQFAPQGVFLQSYKAKVIGNLPEQHFEQLREESVWQRDLILFHLSSFEHLKFLDNLAEHEERKPRAGHHSTKTPVANQTVLQSERSVEAKIDEISSSVSSKPKASHEQQDSKADSQNSTPSSNQGLVKGRNFKIRFGGKMWAAVYWASDEQGAIVAHNTHAEWSLMRLDLTRFKDSLELGEIVDDETMSKIAETAS